jgi:hypothetical protein
MKGINFARRILYKYYWLASYGHRKGVTGLLKAMSETHKDPILGKYCSTFGFPESRIVIGSCRQTMRRGTIFQEI